MNRERLDKWLADRTPYSRKEIKAFVREGAVRIGDRTVTDPSAYVQDGDSVSFRGEILAADKHIYIMLHKPKEVVSVSVAPGDRTVLDLLPEDYRRNGLFPAGRLDRDTTGFVLITDDGDFAHRILSPKKHVEKVYRVTLRDPAGEEYADRFSQGLLLGDGTQCLSAKLEQTDDPRCVRVTLREGRYHQVKRMFASLGNQVVELHRESIGGVSLDPQLPPGGSRLLRKDELDTMTE
ncbi:MAG: 16S rRNA pseudouridine(516) synthase [Clostridia bacterium]|nr:16S rRNA pseudouridine(516) synthase [Clostridia bacterium]